MFALEVGRQVAVVVGVWIALPEGVARPKLHPLTSSEAGSHLKIDVGKQAGLPRIDVVFVDLLVVGGRGVKRARVPRVRRAVDLDAVALCGQLDVRVVPLGVQGRVAVDEEGTVGSV